ncbi:chalcone isomerase family protein [Chelonobacter oris]|uniref:chalcone isomerase family protein n=1 Tax=Chelonobacter oris TaxID=505317 RepID=UPI00244C95E9|nr:chalcone isomerase family protein [Chelonobacter oris]
MKLLKTATTLFALLSCKLASATWLPVGTVDYMWGPFHIYTITLYSENGKYQPAQRPLMLTLNYAKPVEGKNFAITLKKELSNIAPQAPIELQDQWAKKLEQTLPDFQPKDLLNYIALEDTGYFVLNDTVLEPQFSKAFNQAFLDIWLSPQSSFKRLQSQLLGQNKNEEATTESEYSPPQRQLESVPVEDESKDPLPLPLAPEMAPSAPESAEAS